MVEIANGYASVIVSLAKGLGEAKVAVGVVEPDFVTLEAGGKNDVGCAVLVEVCDRYVAIMFVAEGLVLGEVALAIVEPDPAIAPGGVWSGEVGGKYYVEVAVPIEVTDFGAFAVVLADGLGGGEEGGCGGREGREGYPKS